MKEITIKLYEFSELSEKGKKRALADFVESHDDPLMQSHMINLLKEELEERKIKYDVDSIDVRYSLGHAQGDGFMFMGTLYDERGCEIKIEHVGLYYHSYSKQIDYPEASEKEYTHFEHVYQQICKKMEEAGYSEIEYQQSEEYFSELCDANEYLFEANGKMRNE